MIDPQQFNSGGGLLGRLLALPQMQGVYQPDADVDATSVTPPPSASALLPPGSSLAPGNGPSLSPPMSYQALQPFSGTQSPTIGTASSPIGPASALQPPPSQPNSVLGGGAYDAAKPGSSPALRNMVLAQYSPAIAPVGIPLPPVVIPGTPENDAFVHSTIVAGRAIGSLGANALGGLGGLILKNREQDPPQTPPLPENLIGNNARPGKGRAKTDLPGVDPTPEELFDRLTGGQSTTLPDGSRLAPNGVRLRPDTGNGPRIDIPANGDKTHETIHFPGSPK